MPTIVTERGYRFYFWSKEGEPLEPAHIHVERGRGLAKFWLLPDIRLAESRRFSEIELNQIESILSKYRALALRRWNEHFGIR